MLKTRQEHDLIGYRDVPVDAYYGVQTLRATENFPISGLLFSHFPEFIKAYAMVKLAACLANEELALFHQPVASYIKQACDAIIKGELRDQFIIDMVQGGAGTSTNMNVNEVIANKALELAGHIKGDYTFIHPNNHVNMSQSTNDTYPTAARLGIILSAQPLKEALQQLVNALRRKGDQFKTVVKLGRTQLQDAVPMTLGQEFMAHAYTLTDEFPIMEEAINHLLAVNMGGTAIGTGINAHPAYAKKATAHLSNVSGYKFMLADDLIAATPDMGAFVTFSSALKRLAIKLGKFCNDLRLQSSGPRAGLGEIKLPPRQPGSTIMPGKVNPVIPEVVNQIAFHVIGSDATVALASEAGQMQLNAFEPIVVFHILQNISMLIRGINVLTTLCVEGIEANEAMCEKYVHMGISLVTALNPYIGYEAATMVSQVALETNKTVFDVVVEKKLLSAEEAKRILDPLAMTTPNIF